METIRGNCRQLMATFSFLVEHRQYVLGSGGSSPSFSFCFGAPLLYNKEARQERGEERGMDSCLAPPKAPKLGHQSCNTLG